MKTGIRQQTGCICRTSRHARNSVFLEHAHMVSRGSTDGYYEVAKYEIRGRKISNRMDEILAIMMQDNAYREQAKNQNLPHAHH